MKKWSLGKQVQIVLGAGLIVASYATIAFAETATSPHYQMTESEFNSSGRQESCSGQYCSQVTLGSLASGSTESATTTAAFGSLTDSGPVLEVIVDPGESNLGVLSTTTTATKTSVVRVRNYLSNGYVLQITGTPPKYGNHALTAPTSPTASTPGTEQFGINAVANTSPNVGANLTQVPSSQFSFGLINPSYATPNVFKYVSGDNVARSDSSSGRTDYTISMIVNISNKTPAGQYLGDYAAVVIPVY